jgi:hypothetical protein
MTQPKSTPLPSAFLSTFKPRDFEGEEKKKESFQSRKALYYVSNRIFVTYSCLCQGTVADLRRVISAMKICGNVQNATPR